MSDGILSLLRDGGVWILPTGASALMAALLIGGLVVLAAFKKRAPAGLWMLPPLFPLAVGIYGTGWGLYEAELAARTAPIEMAATLMAGGTSIALITSFFGAFCGVVVAVVAAWGAAAGALLAPARLQTRLDLPGLLTGALLTALVGLTIPLLGTMLFPGAGALPLLAAGVLLGVTLPMAAVSARLPRTPDDLDLPDDSDPEAVEALRARHHAQRLRSVALRGAVIGSTVIGLVLAALCASMLGQMEVFKATATAPPEMKDTLAAAGREIAAEAPSAILLAAAAFLLPAAGSWITGGRATLAPRNLAGSALALVPLAALGGLWWIAQGQTTRLERNVVVVRPEVQAAVARVGGLPVLRDPGDEIVELDPIDALASFDGSDWTLEEAHIEGASPYAYGDPTQPGTLSPDLVLALPGDLPVRTLVDLPWADREHLHDYRSRPRVYVLVSGEPEALPVAVAIELHRTGLDPILDPITAWTSDDRLLTFDPGTRSWKPTDLASMQRSPVGHVLVVHDDLRLVDLLGHCSRVPVCRVATESPTELGFAPPRSEDPQ